MYEDRLCMLLPKWKVVFGWGTKYYCTRHKNLLAERSFNW